MKNSDTKFHPDLFGGETVMKYGARGYIQQFRMFNHYRDGTKEKNCGNCKYSYQLEAGSKVVRKCKILGESCSSGTDVSKRKVCNRHEKT